MAEWTKITATGNTADLDGICAVMSMTDNGLMIEDYSDFSLNGMYGELVDDKILEADRTKVRVSVFIPEERHPAEALGAVRDGLAAAGISAAVECSGLDEEDWADSWKKYYHPVHIGRVTIVPAWEDYKPAPDEITVGMDPGMAFGTGDHETTRLCIRLLQGAVRCGDRMLDIGTGSGILSIVGVKLGARSSFACDIDPVAVRVAGENAAREGLSDRISCGVSDLLRGVDMSGGKYTVCTANIVADIIIRMLPDIAACLTDDAPLILSGIVAPRAEDVIKKAAVCGWTVERRECENEWVGLLLRRTGREGA